jgi:hypothetical protein
LDGFPVTKGFSRFSGVFPFIFFEMNREPKNLQSGTELHFLHRWSFLLLEGMVTRPAFFGGWRGVLGFELMASPLLARSSTT